MVRGNRELGVGAIAALGAGLGGIHIYQARDGGTTTQFVLDLFLPLAVSLVLVGAAGLLYRQPYDGRQIGVVLAWLLGGVAVVLSVFVWTWGAVIENGTVRSLGSGLAVNATAGAVLGLGAGIYDVERRRRTTDESDAQAVLQRERDRFATLFENVPSPTVYYEYDGTDPIVIDANTAFEDVFGFAETAIVGDSIDEYIIPPDERSEARDLNRRLRGEDMQVQVTRRTATGLREFLLYTIPLSSEPNRGFATYVDITEQKRREQRLEVLNRVLRHDLRNAMNVIAGHTEQLTESDDPEEAIGTIVHRTKTLIETSRKARTVERVLESDDDHDRPIELGALLEDRIAVARETYTDLRIETHLPDQEVWIAGNELLTVVLDNIIENAAVHVDDRPKLVVHLEQSDPAVVTFNDNGPGIPTPELDVLTSEQETQLEHASGLGLWLVTWIVDDLDGDVEFSNTATGAEASVRFRCIDPPDEREPRDWTDVAIPGRSEPQSIDH